MDDIGKNLLIFLFVSSCNLNSHFGSKSTNAVGHILLLLRPKNTHEFLDFVLAYLFAEKKLPMIRASGNTGDYSTT